MKAPKTITVDGNNPPDDAAKRVTKICSLAMDLIGSIAQNKLAKNRGEIASGMLGALVNFAMQLGPDEPDKLVSYLEACTRKLRDPEWRRNYLETIATMRERD